MADFASSLPIRTEANGDAAVKVVDGTLTSQALAVNADGSVNITDNSGSITVDATNLDIRDLTHVSDSVKVGDGTDLLAVNADGSINVAFAAGAEIKITDGTDDLAINADGSINSVVTATNLDIRDLTHVSDSVKIGDGTDLLAIDASGNIGVTDAGGSLTVDGTVSISGSVTVTASDLDIRDLSHSQDSIKIGDGTEFLAIDASGNIGITDAGGSLTVDATNLDIRDLAAATDTVSAWLKDESGNAFTALNPLPVSIEESGGTEVVDYQTSAALAGAASANFDYTVTASTTFIGEQVFASASGKIKVEVKVETAPAAGTYTLKYVGFNSTANPNVEIPLKKLLKQAAGAKVRVTITNKDNQSQDVYSTLSGLEA